MASIPAGNQNKITCYFFYPLIQCVWYEILLIAFLLIWLIIKWSNTYEQYVNTDILKGDASTIKTTSIYSRFDSQQSMIAFLL